ncbi:helix-turn-helix domain-containing protein [Legionella qingyii]|uniref:helix-turn-helix domain-containing protein n=1 Tax=Legionella qingyii TaxID=2184757 RepID=UPI00227973BA|nr:helix-turn-helix domain-containing protein [Legionella qingyii]
MAHARSKGKAHGRPITAKKHTDKVVALFKTGMNQSEIARQLDIGRTSVRRILNENTLSKEF